MTDVVLVHGAWAGEWARTPFTTGRFSRHTGLTSA